MSKKFNVSWIISVSVSFLVVLSLTHDAKLLAHFTLLFYWVFLRILSVCSLIYFFSLEDSASVGYGVFQGTENQLFKVYTIRTVIYWRSLEVGASSWSPQPQALSVHVFYWHDYYAPLSPNSSLHPRTLAAKVPATSPPTVLKGRLLWKGREQNTRKHFTVSQILPSSP